MIIRSCLTSPRSSCWMCNASLGGDAMKRLVFGASIFLLSTIALAVSANADPAALKALVAKKAGVIELLHGKAERALVTAAQDKTFAKYFAAQTDEERARL